MCFSFSCRKIEPKLSANESTPAVDHFKEAINRVEEPRSAPVGRKAQVTVPPELQHYPDRRKFLAMQAAAWDEWHLEIPHGYLELLDLIEKNGLVEMETVGKDYVLYGVGENTDPGDFSYYDATSGKDISLFADDKELSQGLQRIENSILKMQAQVADFQSQLSKTKDRATSVQLKNQLAECQKQIKESVDKQAMTQTFYSDPVRRTMLFARAHWLTNLAEDFRSERYQLADAAERRRFKMRLLSFIRPEARAVILQIAAIYREKFDRPLPVTSLVRTLEYQKQLHEVNPNATQIDIPPHTTGLAFDIYNGWMTAEEQNFLMSVIARMKSAGRVEALRENRDHIHVFAFPSGRPPREVASSQ